MCSEVRGTDFPGLCWTISVGACKRSAVRARLVPPSSEVKFERFEQRIRRKSTATAARWAAVRVLGSVSSAGAGCRQDCGLQSPLRSLQPRHLRRFSFPGIGDTCRLIVTRLMRAVSWTVTVAVLAGGHRADAAGDWAIPVPAAVSAASEVGVWCRGSTGLPRRATGWPVHRSEPGCAATQPGATTRRALSSRGASRRTGLVMLCPAAQRPGSAGSCWPARASQALRGCVRCPRSARPHCPRDRPSPAPAVSRSRWITSGECTRPASEPDHTHNADSGRLRTAPTMRATARKIDRLGMPAVISIVLGSRLQTIP